MTSPSGSALPSERDLFALPRDVAYLNCAYMGPLPRTGVEAGWVALDRKARPWTIASDDFFVRGELYRSLVADLLGADADGVAITPSVSFGLSTFAAQLRLAPGQVIVVPADEFPSALHPWRAAADAAGAVVERVAPDPDGDRCAPLLRRIDELGDRLALVSAPPCHWTDGRRFDLVALGERCRAHGAALAVDVCQSLGAEPFDAAAVRPDVVAGATYKWLLGPYSLGFAWFAPRWREGAPLDHGWASRAGAEDFTRLSDPSDQHRPGARRYDVGEAAQHQLLPVALAGLRLVEGWGPATTRDHARALSAQIAAGAERLGLDVAPADERSAHLLGLGLADRAVAPATVAGRLADERVHVSVRGRSLRVSVHRFNDDEDVARLLAALPRALA